MSSAIYDTDNFIILRSTQAFRTHLFSYVQLTQYQNWTQLYTDTPQVTLLLYLTDAILKIKELKLHHSVTYVHLSA